jgi:hypothetical protein
MIHRKMVRASNFNNTLPLVERTMHSLIDVDDGSDQKVSDATWLRIRGNDLVEL